MHIYMYTFRFLDSQNPYQILYQSLENLAPHHDHISTIKSLIAVTITITINVVVAVTFHACEQPSRRDPNRPAPLLIADRALQRPLRVRHAALRHQGRQQTADLSNNNRRGDKRRRAR